MLKQFKPLPQMFPKHISPLILLFFPYWIQHFRHQSACSSCQASFMLRERWLHPWTNTATINIGTSMVHFERVKHYLPPQEWCFVLFIAFLSFSDRLRSFWYVELTKTCTFSFKINYFVFANIFVSGGEKPVTKSNSGDEIVSGRFYLRPISFRVRWWAELPRRVCRGASEVGPKR